MSYFIHPNQLPGMLAEHNDYDDSVDIWSISRALRFLEGIDYDDEPLNLRRRHRTERSFETLFVR